MIRMVWANMTQWFGMALEQSVQTSTGSMFLSLMFILIALIMVASSLSITIEWVALIFIPLNIALMSYYYQFLAPGGAILIYLALLIARNLPWK